jgi:hypothetical protein
VVPAPGEEPAVNMQRVAEQEAAPCEKQATGVEPAAVLEVVASAQSLAALSCVHTLATQACTGVDPMPQLGPASGERLAAGVETAVARQPAANVRLSSKCGASHQ